MTKLEEREMAAIFGIPEDALADREGGLSFGIGSNGHIIPGEERLIHTVPLLGEGTNIRHYHLRHALRHLFGLHVTLLYNKRKKIFRHTRPN